MNYLQLELGGEKRGLKFDIGTLKCLQDLYGIDPLSFKAEANTLAEILPYASKIIHAGMVRNCMLKKEVPDITAEQVDEWISELDFPALTDVVSAYNGIFTRRNPSANGEVGADTQPAIV